MPFVDGLEASRQILASQRNHQAPIIIALTAGVASEIRDKCLEAGMKDFISKPFSFSILEKTIVHWGSQLNVIKATK